MQREKVDPIEQDREDRGKARLENDVSAAGFLRSFKRRQHKLRTLASIDQKIRDGQEPIRDWKGEAGRVCITFQPVSAPSSGMLARVHRRKCPAMSSSMPQYAGGPGTSVIIVPPCFSQLTQTLFQKEESRVPGGRSAIRRSHRSVAGRVPSSPIRLNPCAFAARYTRRSFAARDS
jgi:hypothetical protein